jgi:hypothetical protein
MGDENPVEREAGFNHRLSALEQHVESLLKGRPGRKKLPIVRSESGVCGVDPNMDSTKCPHASVYRRQQGCMGDACMRASSEYHKEYRSR